MQVFNYSIEQTINFQRDSYPQAISIMWHDLLKEIMQYRYHDLRHIPYIEYFNQVDHKAQISLMHSA